MTRNHTPKPASPILTYPLLVRSLRALPPARAPCCLAHRPPNVCLVMERMDTSLDHLLYKDPNRPFPLSLVSVRAHTHTHTHAHA